MTQLNSLIPICRAISALLPGQVEVVLHDLAAGRIAHIENAFSPRKIGDDSLTEIQDFQSELSDEDLIGPYLKANSDGGRLRSVSALFRDDQGNPSALMCLNLRLNEIEAVRDMLAALTRIDEGNQPALLRNDWREVANAIIAATLQELSMSFNQIRRGERLQIVCRLLDADIFASRGSADYVSEALGISRASLYGLIKQAKRHSAGHSVQKGSST